MPDSAAVRWNARYSDSAGPREIRPPELVAEALADVQPGDRVLDVACGWGDSGLHLARAGAEVTLTDVSSVALEAAGQRANDAGLSVTTVVADLTVDPLPDGPWDAITCVHYLDRALLPRLGDRLAPEGRLVVAIATSTNLERHDRPSARFLLDPGELPSLLPDLQIVDFSEDWRANDAHEAWLVATRPRLEI